MKIKPMTLEENLWENHEGQVVKSSLSGNEVKNYIALDDHEAMFKLKRLLSPWLYILEDTGSTIRPDGVVEYSFDRVVGLNLIINRLNAYNSPAHREELYAATVDVSTITQQQLDWLTSLFPHGLGDSVRILTSTRVKSSKPKLSREDFNKLFYSGVRPQTGDIYIYIPQSRGSGRVYNLSKHYTQGDINLDDVITYVKTLKARESIDQPNQKVNPKHFVRDEQVKKSIDRQTMVAKQAHLISTVARNNPKIKISGDGAAYLTNRVEERTVTLRHSIRFKDGLCYATISEDLKVYAANRLQAIKRLKEVVYLESTINPFTDEVINKLNKSNISNDPNSLYLTSDFVVKVIV